MLRCSLHLDLAGNEGEYNASLVFADLILGLDITLRFLLNKLQFKTEHNFQKGFPLPCSNSSSFSVMRNPPRSFANCSNVYSIQRTSQFTKLTLVCILNLFSFDFSTSTILGFCDLSISPACERRDATKATGTCSCCDSSQITFNITFHCVTRGFLSASICTEH